MEQPGKNNTIMKDLPEDIINQIVNVMIDQNKKVWDDDTYSNLSIFSFIKVIKLHVIKTMMSRSWNISQKRMMIGLLARLTVETTFQPIKRLINTTINRNIRIQEILPKSLCTYVNQYTHAHSLLTQLLSRVFSENRHDRTYIVMFSVGNFVTTMKCEWKINIPNIHLGENDDYQETNHVVEITGISPSSQWISNHHDVIQVVDLIFDNISSMLSFSVIKINIDVANLQIIMDECTFDDTDNHNLDEPNQAIMLDLVHPKVLINQPFSTIQSNGSVMIESNKTSLVLENAIDYVSSWYTAYLVNLKQRIDPSCHHLIDEFRNNCLGIRNFAPSLAANESCQGLIVICKRMVDLIVTTNSLPIAERDHSRESLLNDLTVLKSNFRTYFEQQLDTDGCLFHDSFEDFDQDVKKIYDELKNNNVDEIMAELQ